MLCCHDWRAGKSLTQTLHVSNNVFTLSYLVQKQLTGYGDATILYSYSNLTSFKQPLLVNKVKIQKSKLNGDTSCLPTAVSHQRTYCLTPSDCVNFFLIHLSARMAE